MPTATPTRVTPVHIRWTIRRDFPEILAIESASSGHPWSEDDFLRVLRQRNCIGMVAESGERVVGFMVYQLFRTHIDVLDFAVHPESRRQGVGRRMAEKLIGKLSPHRRTRLALHVRESNLDGQLFFRAMGFRAVKVERGMYRDSGEDGYGMVYGLDDLNGTKGADHADR